MKILLLCLIFFLSIGCNNKSEENFKVNSSAENFIEEINHIIIAKEEKS